MMSEPTGAGNTLLRLVMSQVRDAILEAIIETVTMVRAIPRPCCTGSNSYAMRAEAYLDHQTNANEFLARSRRRERIGDPFSPVNRLEPCFDESDI